MDVYFLFVLFLFNKIWKNTGNCFFVASVLRKISRKWFSKNEWESVMTIIFLLFFFLWKWKCVIKQKSTLENSSECFMQMTRFVWGISLGKIRKELLIMWPWHKGQKSFYFQFNKFTVVWFCSYSMKGRLPLA